MSTEYIIHIIKEWIPRSDFRDGIIDVFNRLKEMNKEINVPDITMGKIYPTEIIFFTHSKNKLILEYNNTNIIYEDSLGCFRIYLTYRPYRKYMLGKNTLDTLFLMCLDYRDYSLTIPEIVLKCKDEILSYDRDKKILSQWKRVESYLQSFGLIDGELSENNLLDLLFKPGGGAQIKLMERDLS